MILFFSRSILNRLSLLAKMELNWLITAKVECLNTKQNEDSHSYLYSCIKPK